jgi:transposase-like protein
LWKWFLAVYLIVESKKGISANQLKRTLGVSYKTAWYLSHRIRAALNEVDAQLLKGIVEVDETFVGGEMHGKGRGYKGNKVTVVGAIQRSGNICLQVVRGTDRETLHGFIRENVAGDTEAIYTDEWPAYRGVADEDTEHDTVKHRTGEYVRGDVHTNSIENVWSLLKRSIIGSYHQVSAKHLDAYLDELEFRFNNRENPFMFRDAMLKLLLAETLPYAKLVADS